MQAQSKHAVHKKAPAYQEAQPRNVLVVRRQYPCTAVWPFNFTKHFHKCPLISISGKDTTFYYLVIQEKKTHTHKEHKKKKIHRAVPEVHLDLTAPCLCKLSLWF